MPRKSDKQPSTPRKATTHTRDDAHAATTDDALHEASAAILLCVQWIASKHIAARQWFPPGVKNGWKAEALRTSWTQRQGEEYWRELLVNMLAECKSLLETARDRLPPVLDHFTDGQVVAWAGVSAPSVHQAVLMVMEELSSSLRIAVFGAYLDGAARRGLAAPLSDDDFAKAPDSELGTSEGYKAALRVFHDLPPIDVRTTIPALNCELSMAERRRQADSAAQRQDHDGQDWPAIDLMRKAIRASPHGKETRETELDKTGVSKARALKALRWLQERGEYAGFSHKPHRRQK